MSSPIAFQYYKQVAKEFKPSLLAEPNVYLEDVFTSESTNPEKPISSGLFRLEKGQALVYTYTYDEMKIIVDGEFTIADETGQTVKAVPGDHLYFPAGVKITFTTENFGLGFFVGQRKKGTA